MSPFTFPRIKAKAFNYFKCYGQEDFISRSLYKTGSIFTFSSFTTRQTPNLKISKHLGHSDRGEAAIHENWIKT